MEKKQEKIRTYIYIYIYRTGQEREALDWLAARILEAKVLAIPSGSLLAPPLAVPRLVYQRPVYNISPALSAARCLLPDRLRR